MFRKFIEVMELDILDSENSQSNEISSNNLSSVSVNQDCVKSTLTLLDGTFFKYESSSSNGKSIIMTCVKCEPKVVKIKGCGNSSSNFLSHLKRKHGNEAVAEYHEYAKRIKKQRHPSAETRTEGSSTTITQKNFEHDLVLFFISSMIPLNTVEDPFFVRMLNNLGLKNHDINVISRRTLSRKIHEEHALQKSDINLTLQAVQYVCTVVDIWSSRKRSFLGMTAHWIDEDLSRQCKTLACRRFSGIHNYERIAMLLDEIHSEFSLDSSKIVATVTDNGSNFIKAFKEFGVSLQGSDSIDFEEDDDEDDHEENEMQEREDEHQRDFELSCHFRCAAHTLNLCATTDANRILKIQNRTSLSEMHHSVIEKCNLLWNAARRPKTAEIIQIVLGHTLSKPGVTRWNSLYDAMKQIYSIKDKNIQLHRALDLRNYISDREYDYIKEYITCSRPIAEALDILQGETTMYYGLLIPCLMALRKKLQKLEDTPLTYCQDLATTYGQSVEKRFEDFFTLFTPKGQHAIIATLSYPRFKNKWFSCITIPQQRRIKRLFVNETAEEVSKNMINTENRDAADPENPFFEFESDTSSESDSQRQSPKNRANAIVSQYFAEEDRTFDVLNRYPEIKTIFKKFNTPLPSSASVERIFSYATMINLPKSNRLSDNMFEERVMMKTNIKKTL